MIAWLAAAALAGAWTRPLGGLYAKAGADVYDAFTFVAPGHSSAGAGDYFGQQDGIYAEAGVLPGAWKGQLSVAAPLVVGTHTTAIPSIAEEIPVRATTTRLGDLRVAAQTPLLREAPVALSVEVKLPLYANGAVGERFGTSARLFPKPGDGQVDVTPMVFAGASPWAGTFAEVGLGWRFRTEAFVGWDAGAIEFSDGVVFLAKGGHDFGRVIGIVGLDGVVSPEPTAWTRQFVAVAGSALVDLVPDHVALEPRIGTELWARSASRGLAAGLGISVRR